MTACRATVRVRLPGPLRGMRVFAHPGDAEAGNRPDGAGRLLSVETRTAREAAEAEARRAALAALERAFDAARGRTAACLDDLAALAAEIGLTVAGAIVGAAAAAGRTDVEAAVRRCLAEIVEDPDGPEVEVAAHPEDVAVIRGLCHAERRVVVRADDGLERGAVRVVAGAGIVTQDPRVAFERVRERLLERWSAP